MTERVVIIGAGGFGREVLDVIEAINLDQAALGAARYDVLGFLADPAPDLGLLSAYGVPYLGSVTDLEGLPEDVGYVIAIGSPDVRRKIDEYGQSLGRSSPVLVHPSATMGRQVELGPGTVICSHASLTNHITLGRHVHVNLNCTVGHDATLSDYVTLSPLVAISGNVSAEPGAFFGTGCKVNPGLSVGAMAVVGTGAAVIRDVAAGTTVVGVPAKVH